MRASDATSPSLVPDVADPRTREPSKFDENRELGNELQLRAPAGFTLAAAGDCITSRPLSPALARVPGFAPLIERLRKTNIAYGNLETTLADIRTFRGAPYSWDGDWTVLSLPSVAADLRNLGFDVFSRANNHALDWGLEGMRETGHWLDEAGLVHAGTGDHRGLARVAGYVETTGARVGIVSFASTYRPTTDALSSHMAAPGRPGLSALHVTGIQLVTPEVLERVRALARDIDGSTLVDVSRALGRGHVRPSDGPLSSDDAPIVEAFGRRFSAVEGLQAPFTTFLMDETDLAEILRATRQGKENADVLIAAIHSHESSSGNALNEMRADFLQTLAYVSIEAGASAFVTTGIHHIGPIEVYRRRPIFYGLGNFIWSDIQEPLPTDLYQGNTEAISEAFVYPARVTDADLTSLLNAASFADPLYFQGILPICTYGPDGLTGIEIFALDLGYGDPLTTSGIPRLANPTVAQTILDRLARLSKPYKTTINIGDATIDNIATKIGKITVA